MPPTTSRSILLIFLLVPEAATQKHLEILSEIAELLSAIAPLREKIKASTDAAALHRLIATLAVRADARLSATRAAGP